MDEIQTSNLIERASTVLQAYESAVSRLKFMGQQQQDLQRQLEKVVCDHALAVSELCLDQRAADVVKVLIDRTAEGGVRQLEELVTYGLRTIFTDDAYALKIEIGQRGNQKELDLFIVDGKGVKTPMDSCGGGLQVIVSLIIRIYIMLRLKLLRLVIIDEGLDRLSGGYSEGLFEFLRSVVDSWGFTFLVVSHRPEYRELVDRVYDVEHGKVKLLTA